MYNNATLPTILIITFAVIFLVVERLFPGRELPHAKNWYFRAIFINFFQILITFATNGLWNKWFNGYSFLNISIFHFPILEGFIGWIVGSFFFYWWHRLRHKNWFWHIFHQIHHSPKRIETITSFYKHPIEILSDSLLSALILYVLLGASLEGALWFNFFAAVGEFFYHSNIKTYPWMRYFIQTPELHSVHHELDVHRYNFGDLPIWDRLFWTYRDTTMFVKECGFPNNNERKLLQMLFFKDVYNDKANEKDL